MISATQRLAYTRRSDGQAFKAETQEAFLFRKNGFLIF
jgi:hypothetical protein